jgi:hypothetical protein
MFLLRTTDLIRCNVARYIHAPHNEGKRAIILEIIHELEQQGRFLKPKGRGWSLVSREEAKKKVAHALQYYQRTLRAEEDGTNKRRKKKVP